ncbi:hypothetical protein P5V15_006658 [Pogonomyrmex californicus]
MVDEKRKRAAEISEESRQLKLILIKQKEEDARRKTHLVQEIKTLQTSRLKQIKSYDPTKSSGLGFLCEMSLTELKEQLLSTKIKQNEEIARRNMLVRQECERRKNLMKNCQQVLERHKIIN